MSPPSAPTDRWLVVGLGNPGPGYAEHRHNVGHMVVDLLVSRTATRLRSLTRARADVAEGRLGGVPGVPVTMAKPRSYMNDSGGPVAALLGFYKVSPAQCVVVHDELDIPFGALRLKVGGGDNGHNGLRSIRRSIGTGDYARLRVGVGRPPGRQDAADFLLSPFSSTERKELDLVLERAADALECLVLDGLTSAQNTYHVDA